MNTEMNSTSLESLDAAMAYAMGVTPPEHAAPANEDMVAYIDRCLEGSKADRVFIYNTDAIGQWLIEKYPELSAGAMERMELELPMYTVNPPKTPIAFGTMYTGAAPAVHGIVQYEKKLITIDTLFDALVRAGKKVALLTRNYYSMAVIFANRPIDYYFCDTWPDVNAKAAELIMRDEYDFILTYNANFDDVMHKKGPESIEALSEMRYNFQTFCMFDTMIRTHWQHHNVLIGTGMDHGCHTKPDGTGTHCDDTPEDRNIIHYYKIYPATK
jgi:hypothetical protein